jgi:D-alanyl-lipoteichoic acid acyltransferase DltB (MBOAT superfamily)
MLFNSFSFLFAFLPVTAFGFFLIARKSHLMAAGWLALASLAFYAWSSIEYVPLLLASIIFNYVVGWRIAHAGSGTRKKWLVFGLTVDLALLAYFKYADFLISSINTVTAAELPSLQIILPVGISFFTFTQIAYLVDTYQGKVKEYRPAHYLLFVTYFPHLIAGPVLHHKEMMPQFDDPVTYRFSVSNLAVGFAIFTIGLAKKVLIADNLAPHANFFFDHDGSPTLFEAWGGVLAYTFQLYFDFSGYSDMAIGLSRIFGIRLPLNFNSPYKASNIIEFWRRWHMTLSRFLRDYLYIVLGGNRKGPARRYANLMITMVLGGLWHGAGWNFVIWGALHGSYLMVNHAWAAVTGRLRFPHKTRTWAVLSVVITFAAVCVAWVFFRATNVTKASEILVAMAGFNGVALPDSIGLQLGTLRDLLERAGVTFYLGGGARFVETWTWVVIGSMIAFGFPNTQQIMNKWDPALDYVSNRISAGPFGQILVWRPAARWACFLGLIMVVSLLSLSRPAEFLYFQF